MMVISNIAFVLLVVCPLTQYNCLLFNHVMESDMNQFSWEKRSGNNRSSGVGSNQIYYLLPMALNQVPSYNEFVEVGDVK